MKVRAVIKVCKVAYAVLRVVRDVLARIDRAVCGCMDACNCVAEESAREGTR